MVGRSVTRVKRRSMCILGVKLVPEHAHIQTINPILQDYETKYLRNATQKSKV